MAKKHKRPPVKARQPSHPATPDAARADLEAGRLREAIAAFKDLLKQGPTDELRNGLAEAYEGRARQLAEKGMLKEALVMWENRATLGEVPWRLGHAALLLRLGRIEQVMGMLDRPQLNDDPGLRARLMSHLAAQLLGGVEGIAEALPADDPIRVQAIAAEEAMDAYCAGNDQALAEALQSIPFRSPYRDLVQILKALMRLDPASRDHRGDWADEVRSEAASLLARVGDDSGFAHLRDAARLAILAESELAPALRDAGPATRDLVFALRGWPQERAALWTQLQALGESPDPKDLLRIMFRYRRTLGDAWVHERGLRLLLPNVRTGAQWWIQAGGIPLKMLDEYLIDAWESEAGTDPWQVATYWQDYANLLSEAATRYMVPGSDPAVLVALARRRADSLFDITSHFAPDSDPDSLPAIVSADLESSLEYDPDDRGTYLRLIGHYLRGNALKDARRILKLAQTRWPTDKAILTAAMDTALASGAYKKAATIAAEILAVDPINSGVRERLVDAHLGHARKNMMDQRPDLASRALAQAEAWSRSERTRERLEIMRALIEIRAGDAEGETRLRNLAEALGKGLAARLVLLLEANACGMLSLPLLKRIGLGKSPNVDEADLRAFFIRLRAHLDSGAKVPYIIGQELIEPLKRAARLTLDRGELESICETLRRTDLDDARLAFASAALKRWRGEPVFELHAFEARYGGVMPWDVRMSDLLRLEQALEAARDKGDSRLVHRLIELLNSRSRPFGISPRSPFGGGFGDPVWDDIEDDESDVGTVDTGQIEMFTDLIRTLGPDGFRDLMKTPGPIGESLRALERLVGKEQLRIVVETIWEGLDSGGPPIPSRRSRGPSPRPSRGGGSKPKDRGAIQRERTGDPDDDPDLQLDLFK
jgi:tetratricopeptide (TPR) repeat protein